MAKKKLTFEESLEKLEQISEDLESESTGIDESIKLYEEGIELSKNCFDLLNKAELKITELRKKLESENSIEEE